MVCQWESAIEYHPGAVVQHYGTLYQVIKPHRSEPNWQPPQTRGLWSPLLEATEREYISGQRPHRVEHYHRDADLARQFSNGKDGRSDPPQPGGWGHDKHTDTRVNPPVIREGWLNEKRKHQLEIVGAILGSLSRDGGVFAFSRNEAKEAAKSAAWSTRPSREKWLQGAYAHTNYYSAGGQLAPLFWILVNKSDPIPYNAIDGGREAQQPLYIGRVFYIDGLHVGKVSPHTGCGIVLGGKEIGHFDKYEILCGDQNAVNWVQHYSHDGKIEGLINHQKWNPVEGGREGCGRCQFISQVGYNGNLYPCKALAGAARAYFPLIDGKEHYTNTFKILVYAEATPHQFP